MAKLIIDVIHQSTSYTKQIEIFIDDKVLSKNLSNLPELIKGNVTQIDSDFKVLKFSLIADEGIRCQ